MPKSIADQIKDLEAQRAARAARLTEIMAKAAEEGRSTDEAESEEFDTVESEIKQIDADLLRSKRVAELAAQATPVVNVTTTKKGAEARGNSAAIIVKSSDADEKFQGQFFTRMVIARAMGFLHQCSASGIAQQRWGKTNPTLVALIKANEIAGGGSGSGEWGAELVQADTRYTGDFIEYLNSITLFNKLGLREIPANVVIKGQDGAATGYWVGESKAIPASKPDFSSVSLSPLKVAALAVVSNELLRDSSPAAEQLVRDALAEASAQRVDTTFLSATAASAGVSPAGILNGLSAIGTSGPDEEGLREDIKALYAPFISAKNASGLVYVMNPSLAKTIQLMRNALGQRAFEGITANGGTLEGDPVVTGDNVAADDLILLKPSDIYKIGDSGVQVSMSRDATIEQNSSPSGATDTPVAAANTLTSMFQEESTALKVVRSINFAKRRTSAVAYVGNAAYGLGESGN